MDLNNMLFTESHYINNAFINTTMRIDVINNIILSMDCTVNLHKMSESFKGSVLFKGTYAECVEYTKTIKHKRSESY